MADIAGTQADHLTVFAAEFDAHHGARARVRPRADGGYELHVHLTRALFVGETITAAPDPDQPGRVLLCWSTGQPIVGENYAAQAATVVRVLSSTADASAGAGMAIDQREALQNEYPQWKIWPSDAGHWYASRRHHLSRHAHRFGVWQTVDAADLDGLRAELVDQAAREETAVAMLGSLT
jgi:hypothetical protein